MNKKYSTRFFVLVIIYSFLFSCGKKQEQQAPPPAVVKVVAVEKRNLPLHKDFVGQLYGVRDVPIRARVDGYLEGVHFNEGSMVKKGQLLYTIDPQPFVAALAERQSNLAQLQVKATKAKSDLDRYIPLAEINAVSQSDLDARQAEYDASLASVDAAEASVRMAQIDLSYTKIYSPIRGIIGKTKAKVGEYVGRDPNPVILNNVSRTDSMLVQYFISENEYLSLYRKYLDRYKRKPHSGEETPDDDRGIIELYLSDGTKFDQLGKFDFMDREVDPSTGSILIQVSFPNPELILRPGQFGKVRMVVDSHEEFTVVPSRSITELQGQDFVYVVGKDNVAKQREVKKGAVYNDYLIIKEGVKTGELVVIEGLQKVRDGGKVVPTKVKFESQYKEQE
ncbi:efflux RND transporter periplasmic adaptor subunit [Sediminitomix flava]|uniref:Membrane fusion protein (Multidrug efflux system) n=1 Tax=Sediminitomix flava TaxID=379075 RepID=A0A315ZHZ4_SEDFL|nr:efflux RND transporter periplasmic adaptor subunit [Sediminitomix flava]PWJ44829.1 membrane fusion protein (multidrug efflux system) [Sediminitomix flava]